MLGRHPSARQAMSAYEYSFTSIDGEALPLSEFKGKPILIVNTASKCGLTPQYAGLEDLERTYGPKGLILIGVPSNDFGGQEPGTEAEIKRFCDTKFGVTFPMTRKEKVTGSSAHPFYKWAAETLGADKTPKWNFHKYLVNADGTLGAAFGSRTEPTADEIISAIEARLPG
jgi:glutathione peroxidase